MVCPENKKLLKQVFTFEGDYSVCNVARIVGNVVFSPIYFPLIILPLFCARSRKYKKEKAKMKLQLYSESIC